MKKEQICIVRASLTRRTSIQRSPLRKKVAARAEFTFTPISAEASNYMGDKKKEEWEKEKDRETQREKEREIEDKNRQAEKKRANIQRLS